MREKLIIAIFFFLPDSVHAQSIWNLEHLLAVKASIEQPAYQTAYRHLIDEAEQALNSPCLSVMMKEQTAVSGDKHDYLSLSRYFWPDPTKPDGLPYINRDGVANPEREKLEGLHRNDVILASCRASRRSSK